MTEFKVYRICSSCFNELYNTANFVATSIFTLVDRVDGYDYTYLLDESVPCNPEVHDELNA